MVIEAVVFFVILGALFGVVLGILIEGASKK
jgi:hypothetical protein